MRTTFTNLLILTLAFALCLGCEKPADNNDADNGGQNGQATPGAAEDTSSPADEPDAVAVTPTVGETKLNLPQADTEAIDAETAQQAGRMINEALAFFAANQDEDGGWSLGDGAMKPAITGLVAKAMVQHPDLTAETPIVAKAYEILLSYQQDNGGIYDPDQGQQNYTTAIAVMALAAADDPKFKEPLAKAVDYLLSLQIVPGSETPDDLNVPEDSPWIGGVSYGKHGRPDLSNVGFWVQALHEAGVEGDDPAMQRALKFVTRTQNLSETNPLEFAREGTNDGGFIYAPAQADQTTPESKAGQTPVGGMRSYGSMTYVGFKSLLYAGLGKDDPRVKAAYSWIRRYWQLDSNPNMPGKQSLEGLYYYYHAFAKALRAFGQPEIPAIGKDVTHNWRAELIAALAERQNDNGSWTNKEDRWGESHPNLATAYSVLALQETLKK